MRSVKLPKSILGSGAAKGFDPPLRHFFSLLLSVLVFCCTTSIAFSQQVTTRVNGTVKDTAGATVPGAKITLIDAATKVQKTALTNEEGNFVIADVQPGTYLVTVEGTG